MSRLAVWLALFITWMASGAHAIVTEQVLVPDADGPLALRIWYPDATRQPRHDERLPLIVISHGAGSDNEAHEDTARALAAAGFAVAAIEHTGDTYRDHSALRQGRQLVARLRHVSSAIDYMLAKWHGHDWLDPKQVGMFGFSAGGFTALVVGGGQPDLYRVEPHCQQQPEAWDCRYLARNGVAPRALQSPAAWIGDARVRAVVVAAPAVAYSFEPRGLDRVNIPVQLWSAKRDDVVVDGAERVRRLLPAAPEYHAVDNAGHFSFLAPCTWSLRAIIAVMHLFGTDSICSDPEGFDRRQFHERFNAEVVEFFRRNLHA